MCKRKLVSFAFFSLASISSWGITQDGSIGATSTGYIDAPFEITRYLLISGLQDISFTINPGTQVAPLSSAPVTICLYSSTGRANVVVETTTPTDYINHRATLEGSSGSAPFEITLDNVAMFASTPPIFDASVSTTDCSDNKGKHDLIVTLPQIPALAGVYQATVTVTISASDI